MTFQGIEHRVVKPRGMAELDRRRQVLWQDRKKILQPIEIMVEVRGQLKQHGAELVAQHIELARQVLDRLGCILQAQLMGNPP